MRRYALQNECGEPIAEGELPAMYNAKPEPRLVVHGRRAFLRSAMHDVDEPGAPMVYRETAVYWTQPASPRSTL